MYLKVLQLLEWIVGKPAIIDKLRTELSHKITTERQVVYILAEVRKLMEVTGEADNYFALNFHCCWALHTKMSRDGARRILERFDKAHEEAIAVVPPDPYNLSPESQEQVHDTMSYRKFRIQMREYLTAYGLPLDLVDSDLEWVNFLSLYTEVIEECPLVLTNVNLNHITEVTVYKLREGWPATETADGIVYFIAEWRLTCKDPKHEATYSNVFVIPKKPIRIRPSQA